MKTFIWFILILFLSGAKISGNENAGTYFMIGPGLRKTIEFQRDTARINKLTAAGIELLSKKSGFDKVKSCIDSAVMICDKERIEVPSLLHLLISQYNYLTGDLRTSSEEAALALKQSSDNREFRTFAKTSLFMGRYYLRTGMFKESLESYENVISTSRKHDIKGLIPWSYLGQAGVYESLGDLKSMRNSLIQMTKAGFAEKDTAIASEGYYRLGTSYCGDSSKSARRNFVKADSLLRESKRLSELGNDSSILALAYANLGWNFYLEKMYDSSLVNYNRSLRYSLSDNKYSASVNSIGNMGTIYRDLGQYEKSLDYYRKAIARGILANDIYNLSWIYGDMSNLYLKLKDTSGAYQSYVQFKKYSDLLLVKSNTQGLADARIRYEADSHRKEVELLSLRLKNRSLLNYGFAGLAALTMIIAFLLYRGSQLRNKKHISEMNHKISEITQANLRQQMNPHFIFNTLNSIQYYMYQHDKLATNNYLTKFSNLMRKVLDNSQHTSIPLSDELAALKLYLELESIRFKDKFDFEIKVDEEIDPLMYKVPTMLIQPYVENSICHGLIPMEGKGLVKVDLKLQADHILCTIEDNGIGREASKERNLKREQNHNSLGTQITKSRLDLVNELYGTSLKIIYTDLKNEGEKPSGTRVEIHIPILT